MTTTPDLTTYDAILVNSSAGKDSQAMLDYVARLAAEAGVSDRIIVVHCDLGRVEWEGTRELAAEHAAHYGFAFEVVSRPQGDLLTQVEQRKASLDAAGKDSPPWPSSAARWCTSQHKTGQVTKLMTALVKLASLDRKARILNCLGIRADESPARAKKDEFGPDAATWSQAPKDGQPGKPHSLRTVDRWLPIFDWDTCQVWERIGQAGTRHHWAYDEGMPRLSCCFCVLASRSSLVRSAQLNPALAAEYVAVEVRVGSRFTAKASMAEIVAEAEATAPVTVEDWAA